MTDISIYGQEGYIIFSSQGKILMVRKEQIKTIDQFNESTVRLNIGEGPLKNIFINVANVIDPILSSVEQLIDFISQLMITPPAEIQNNNPNGATEPTLVAALNQLTWIHDSLDTLAVKDVTQLEPTFVDETQQNTVYKGWHQRNGDPNYNEWAIERITHTSNLTSYEWAGGTKAFIHQWANRLELNYGRVQYGSIE